MNKQISTQTNLIINKAAGLPVPQPASFIFSQDYSTVAMAHPLTGGVLSFQDYFDKLDKAAIVSKICSAAGRTNAFVTCPTPLHTYFVLNDLTVGFQPPQPGDVVIVDKTSKPHLPKKWTRDVKFIIVPLP